MRDGRWQRRRSKSFAFSASPLLTPLQSALGDIEEAYQSRVNQYVGVLPPTLASQVQRIGMEALSLNIGSYDYTVRDSINTAIESCVLCFRVLGCEADDC